MQRPRPRAATRFGRGRLNVITRRLIQITFRDWRGDINHGDTATIISKYRYRLNRPPRPNGSPDRCAMCSAHSTSNSYAASSSWGTSVFGAFRTPCAADRVGGECRASTNGGIRRSPPLAEAAANLGRPADAPAGPVPGRGSCRGSQEVLVRPDVRQAADDDDRQGRPRRGRARPALPDAQPITVRQALNFGLGNGSASMATR